ncbi:ATP-dependent RNA helicase glh-1-like isoform X2 [Nannospalax galili]|uniref:ATP-dependent RNA helicase glh-1-like isoform X2 n=1 Tax=Nannospalax galili TaxID=1026970 RepID=UPI000819C2EA|nr:ATP-dependent RNA helicase glh-1-like isoform X2 [Nannospalax galili]
MAVRTLAGPTAEYRPLHSPWIRPSALWAPPKKTISGSTVTEHQPPGPCFRCGQVGHWAKQCPNPRPPPGPCPQCGQRGHWRIDCPSLPRQGKLLREHADRIIPQVSKDQISHPLQLGDSAYLLSTDQHKELKGTLQLRWTGPHLMILSTPSTAKLLRQSGWIHFSKLKPAQEYIKIVRHDGWRML